MAVSGTMSGASHRRGVIYQTGKTVGCKTAVNAMISVYQAVFYH